MRFDAYYSDGRSAARRRVTAFAGPRGLHIHDSGGDPLEDWSYQGLRQLEEVYRDQPVRFGHTEKGEATLTFEDGRILAAIDRLTGHRPAGPSWLRASRSVALLALTLVLVVGGVLLAVLPHLTAPLAALVPAQWEQALGEQVAAYITGDKPFCEGQAGQAALEALAARLTAGRELPHPLALRVSSRAGVNAFAAPGGRIVVLRGLIEQAQGPEEVAGVLAHEIAHGLERHPMQNLLRALGIQFLFGALMGDASLLQEAAGRFTQLLVIFSYTREDELAADRIAVELLNQAGLRGDGLLSFFRRLEEQNAGAPALPRLLSTHPLTSERTALIESTATGKGEAMSEQQWAALRAICAGVAK